MLKCSFCEKPLVCKMCRQPVYFRGPEGHLAVYQPDMQVACPACQKVLICKDCGFVYGDSEEAETADPEV